MGDELVEREAPLLDEAHNAGEIVGPPLRGDAQPRLAHEGGRKGESERALVETREDDFAARRESRDQIIENLRIAAHIVDDAIVAARIRCRDR